MTLAFRRTAFALAAIAITACEGTATQTPQFTAADEAEVRAIFDSTVARVRAADFDAWAGEYTDRGVLHPPNAKALSGREALLAWGKAFPAVDHFSMSDIQVWGEGNLAYGTSAIVFKAMDAPVDTAKQLVVFRRSAAGRWEVEAASFNSDLPVATTVPAPPARR